MRLSECGARFICGFEGFSPIVYLDSVGVATIGFGTTDPQIIAAWRGRSVSREQAMAWLRDDVDRKYGAAVNRWANDRSRLLTPSAFDALTSFTYNLGSGIIGNPNTSLRAALDSHGDVAAAMRLYDRAGGKALPGLTRRRIAEGVLWDTGDYGFECSPTRARGEDNDERRVRRSAT